METELTIQVECEGTYVAGTKDYFSKSHGNWLPGDAPEVKDFKVFFTTPKGERVEITSWLDAEQLEKLEQEFAEMSSEEG